MHSSKQIQKLKKQCVILVVPGNGQALLRMPDMAVLNIINLNIDSIQVEITSCKTNRGQQTHAFAEGSTKRDTGGIIKQEANGQNGQNHSNKSINYFYCLKDTDADKRKSSTKTQKIHDTFGNVFNGFGCFEGTFSLQLKPDSKSYQVPPRHVAYVLQKPFKEELKQLQGMDFIAPLGVDKMAEWCNSFVLVPKANGKGQLCLDPVQLNQALIRLIHRGPTLPNILPRLK